MFVILVIAIWLPRVLALDTFVTVDEPRWLTDSAGFYSALRQGDFAGTYQSEHPGVTVLWAGTMGILSRYPAFGNMGEGGLYARALDFALQEEGLGLLELLVAGRFFVVLGHTVALALVYLLARRLFGRLPAFVGVLFIAFDPYHAAFSRFLHTDGVLSSLILPCLLAFYCYLQERRFRFLVLSGIAAGSSWLTKVPGVFLIPTIALVALGDCVSRLRTRGSAGIVRVVWQSLWPLLVWGVLGLAVFLALWPAMWVDPIGTVSRVFTESLIYAEGGHAHPVFFNGTIFTDGEIDPAVWYFYPLTYFWRTTPVILVGLALAAVAFVLKRDPLAEPKARQVVMGLLLFVLLYAVVMTLGTKKFDRYLLPIYPPLDLMAALGWIALVKWLGTRSFPVLRRLSVPGVLGAAILIQALAPISTFPYYLTYYNPLMGGSRKAPEAMMIGWGEGLDKAAAYLDEKPDANDLVVACWYRQSLSSFFSGRTRKIAFLSDLSESQLKRVLTSDYAIIYVNQWQRQMPRNLLDLLAPLTPEHTIWIDGLEYARIYKMSDSASEP